MLDDRHRVEELQAGREDSRRIRRHLDRLIEDMLSTAARGRGKDEGLSALETVPDPDQADEQVSSL